MSRRSDDGCLRARRRQAGSSAGPLGAAPQGCCAGSAGRSSSRPAAGRPANLRYRRRRARHSHAFRLGCSRRSGSLCRPPCAATPPAALWRPCSRWPDADQPSRHLIDLGTTVLIYVLLGWGLNVVVGLAGLLDLGYVAFYAVGAYTFALLATDLGFTFWQALPFSGLVAASFGIVLGFPVLRLRGDYLAIVTLGFGEITRIVLLNWAPVTGGPNGIGGIPRPSFFGLPFARSAPEDVTTFHQFFGLEFSPDHRVIFLYFVILGMALITNLFTLRIRRLPLGRAWEALREDEVACRALGINPTNVKLSAFAIGAMFGGLAGCFFATRQGFISPESFT